MGKKKRIRSNKSVVISSEPSIINMMESQYQGTASHAGHHVGAGINHITSLADLPELDDGLSSSEYSSEYLSTGNASLMDPELDLDLELDLGHMEVDDASEDDEADGMEAMSLYAPAPFPVVSMHNSMLRPFDDGATV
jgi:hypothetical protein